MSRAAMEVVRLQDFTLTPLTPCSWESQLPGADMHRWCRGRCTWDQDRTSPRGVLPVGKLPLRPALLHHPLQRSRTAGGHSLAGEWQGAGKLRDAKWRFGGLHLHAEGFPLTGLLSPVRISHPKQSSAVSLAEARLGVLLSGTCSKQRLVTSLT